MASVETSSVVTWIWNVGMGVDRNDLVGFPVPITISRGKQKGNDERTYRKICGIPLGPL